MSLNNYYQILNRGSNYTASAAINWIRRKKALNKVWFTAKTVEQKQKLLNLIVELNERIYKLEQLVEHVRRQQRQLAIESQNQFAILECANRLCQDGPGGFIMSVKIDRFEEGDYHCGNCGYVMRLEGSTEMDEMLEEMGIGLPKFA